MTTKFWLGGVTGDYNDAANWTYGRLPTDGDFVQVAAGVPVIYQDTDITYTLDIASINPQAPAILEGVDANITNDGLLATGSLDGSNPDAIYTGSVDLYNGSLINNGWIAAVGAHSAMTIGLTFAPLINNGRISSEGPGASVTIAAGSPLAPGQPAAILDNSGFMQANGGTLDLAADVEGFGQISVANGGRLVADAPVGGWQTITLTSGMLEVTNPARMSFYGTVNGLTPASTMQIDGGWADTGSRRLSLSHITQDGETLSLKEQGTTLFAVQLAGHYSLADFHLAQQGTAAMIGYEHIPPVNPVPAG